MAVPYLFRSYIHRLCLGQKTHLNPNNDGCPLTICEVARATSAAPGYFKVLKLPNTNHVFMDGGIRANNPSLVAWNEVLQMARIDNPSITGGKAVGCFISVGTGKSQYQIFGREKQLAVSKYFNMNKAPKKMITDTVGIQNKRVARRLLADSTARTQLTKKWRKLQKNSRLHTSVSMCKKDFKACSLTNGARRIEQNSTRKVSNSKWKGCRQLTTSRKQQMLT